MKIIYFIFFIQILNANSEEGDDIPKCNQQIINSYHIQPLVTPTEQPMHLFPTISYSCCSIYDQYYMYLTWKNHVKKGLMRYQRDQMIKMKKLLWIVTKLLKLNLKRLLRIFRFKIKDKTYIIKNWGTLKLMNKKLDKDIKTTMRYQAKALNFTSKMKTAFFGIICDWENQEFINIEARTIQLNQTTCAYIAKNTGVFSYLYHHKVLKYLYYMLNVVSKFNNTVHKPDIKLADYKKIFKDVAKCYKQGLKRGKWEKCYDYCNYYKVNSYSPVMEGYTSHLSIIIEHLKKFYYKARKYIPKKRKRVPTKYSGYIKLFRRRILVMNDKIPAIEAMRKKEIQKMRQKLPKKLMLPGDPYKRHHLMGGMTKHQLHTVTGKEKTHFKERLKNYVNYIKNNLIDLDYQDEFLDMERPDEIFLEISDKIEGLESYQTVTDDSGINLKNIVKKTSINKTFKDLVGHVKRNSIYELTFEPLDPKLVRQLNNIDDFDLKNFHRDNYMLFKKQYGQQLNADRLIKLGKQNATQFTKLGYSSSIGDAQIILNQNFELIYFIF